MAKESLKNLLSKLTAEDMDSLKKLVADELRSQIGLETEIPGFTTLYNRSSEPFEAQLNSKPIIIGAHKTAQFPSDIAAFLLRKSAYKDVGTENVKRWLVPAGHEFFGVPLDKNKELTGDLVKDYPIPLRATVWDEDPNEHAEYARVPVRPRGADEPPVKHREGNATDAEVLAVQ